jgi:hypothetical protein
MLLSPALRRLALTLHVVASVAFPGAVACFFALALVGLKTDPATAQALYRAMDLMTWLVIVPLCFASLVSGLTSSLGTPWGVFRYWWVIVKLVVTVFSTFVLLLHLRPIRLVAENLPSAATVETQVQLAAAAGLALVALVFMTALSIYKPRGLTRYGARQLAR